MRPVGLSSCRQEPSCAGETAVRPCGAMGNGGRIEAPREICSHWFEFWRANRIWPATEPTRIMLIILIKHWYAFVHLWAAAANANLDQANAWLKGQEVRAAFLDSLLREEGHGVESPPIVDRLATGVGGLEDESWPHRPPWLDARVGQFGLSWAKHLRASFLPKPATKVEGIGSPMLFASLAERLNLLDGICATLVSWCNHATRIGLLPPACAIEADPTKLSLSARRRLRSLIEPIKAEARSPISESEAGSQFASHNTIAKMLLEKKELEITSGREKRRGDLVFPNVAERLKARAQRLLSDIEGLPPLKDPGAEQLVFNTFSMLEKELIRAHRIPVQAEHTYLHQWHTRFNELSKRGLVENLVSEYRELVPGGDTATDKELVELGLDGIFAAVEKCWDQKIQALRVRKAKRSPPLL